MSVQVPPGLTCCECHQPFDRQLVRRTRRGWQHTVPCASPVVLTEGAWVNRGGVRRWEAVA